MLSGIILVRLSYTDHQVSQYEWFIFGVFALSFFWSVGLKNALLTYYPELKLGQQKKVMGSLFLFFTLVAFLLSVFGSYLLFQDAQTAIYFVFFFTLSVPSTLLEQFFILHNRSHELLSFGLWIHILFLLFILIAALVFGTVQTVLIALVIWALVKFVFTIVTFSCDVEWKIDMEVLINLVVYSVPLIMYSMLGSGMDVLDGFMVEYFYGDDLFAKYRYGAKELPLTALVIGALVSAMIPQLVSAFENSMTVLRSKIDKFMNWMFPLSICLLIVSPYLYTIVYSEDYLLSAQIFNTYLLILTSRILTPQAILYALKENKTLMWTAVVELIVNMILSLVLIQHFGIIGIAYATVIAYALEKIILILYLHFKKNISITRYLNIGKYTIGSIMLLITYLIVSI